MGAIKSLAELRAGFATDPPGPNSRFDEADPRRVRRLSLHVESDRARRLLSDWESNVDPRERSPRLSDARNAIAGEHGFAGWSQLAAHIERSETQRRAMRGDVPGALDGGERVLHIRCGTDIMNTLAVAGFSGDFLPFYDPYVHGPVPATESLDDFLRIRADYISRGLLHDYDKVIDDLRRQYAALARVHDYQAAYLWFEHDSYDQLILAKLLDFFSDATTRPAVLKFISVTHYPGEDFDTGGAAGIVG